MVEDGPKAAPLLLRRPLVPTAFFFLIGTLITPAFPWPVHFTLGIATTLGVLALANRRRVLSVLLLPLACMFAGVVVGVRRLPPKPWIDNLPAAGEPILVEGIVAEAPALHPDYEDTLIDVAGFQRAPEAPFESMHGRVRLRIRRRASDPTCAAPGERIRALTRLAEPAPKLMPRGTSARARAARRGVGAFGSVPRGGCVAISNREKSGFFSTVERTRNEIRGRIDAALSGDRAALVRALSIGDRSGLSEGAQETFRRSGLSHLLAVSGLHLAVVVGMLFFSLGLVFRRIPPLAERFGADRAAAMLTLSAVPLYTLMVGATPSAVRAAVMVSVLLLGQVLRRPSDTMSSLAFAAIVMVAYDPSSLGDVSFQLSFAAVAGLVRLTPVLAPSLGVSAGVSARWRKAGLGLVIASVAATIGTLPLVARHFGRVPILGIVANVVALPLTSLLVVPASLLGALLSLVHSGAAELVLKLAGAFSGGLLLVARGVAALPLSSVDVPSPTVLECLLFYLASIGFSVRPARPASRKLALAAVGIMLVSMAATPLSRWMSRDLKVAFLPVGQGDAAVVELPGGDVLVVDTGPSGPGRDGAERAVLPYLRRRRIGHVDHVMITHAHDDHAGGLQTLTEGVRVGQLWFNGDRRDASETLEALLDAGGAKVLTSSSPPMRFGDVELRVLSSFDPSRAESQSVNDASLVVSLGYRGKTVLLTGDIEAPGETRLVSRRPSELRADVLKVAHHGSDGSTTMAFVEVVRSKVAVISCGRRNRFGFPDAPVLARLESAGAEIYRTDENGLVEVILDSDGEIEVIPFRPE